MHERDWMQREIDKREWAIKRAGKAVAQIDKREHGKVDDKLMREFLQKQGLIPADPDEQAQEEQLTTVESSAQ